jgi:hypothetical protein
MLKKRSIVSFRCQSTQIGHSVFHVPTNGHGIDAGQLVDHPFLRNVVSLRFLANLSFSAAAELVIGLAGGSILPKAGNHGRMLQFGSDYQHDRGGFQHCFWSQLAVEVRRTISAPPEWCARRPSEAVEKVRMALTEACLS